MFLEFCGLRGRVGALLVYRDYALGQRERDLVHICHLPGAFGAVCGGDGFLWREVRASAPGEFGVIGVSGTAEGVSVDQAAAALCIQHPLLVHFALAGV